MNLLKKLFGGAKPSSACCDVKIEEAGAKTASCCDVKIEEAGAKPAASCCASPQETTGDAEDQRSAPPR